MDHWQNNIGNRLTRRDLLGWEAHKIMATKGRYRSDHIDPRASEASVLILLYPVADSVRTVFIRRNSRHEGDKHRGQISFPGGKRDAGDLSSYQTAKRETREEIGIDDGDLRYLGQLSSLYIPVSNFVVSPFVATIDYQPVFSRDVKEVDQIIEANLEEGDFLRNQKFVDLNLTNDFLLRDIPHFNVEGHVVWGATAMILAEFFSLTGLSLTMPEVDAE